MDMHLRVTLIECKYMNEKVSSYLDLLPAHSATAANSAFAGHSCGRSVQTASLLAITLYNKIDSCSMQATATLYNYVKVILVSIIINIYPCI